MGDVVNLRRFRKARERAGRAEDAARNRAASGRTRAERDASADAAKRAAAALDAHRLDGPGAPARSEGPSSLRDDPVHRLDAGGPTDAER